MTNLHQFSTSHGSIVVEEAGRGDLLVLLIPTSRRTVQKCASISGRLLPTRAGSPADEPQYRDGFEHSGGSTNGYQTDLLAIGYALNRLTTHHNHVTFLQTCRRL